MITSNNQPEKRFIHIPTLTVWDHDGPSGGWILSADESPQRIVLVRPAADGRWMWVATRTHPPAKGKADDEMEAMSVALKAIGWLKDPARVAIWAHFDGALNSRNYELARLREECATSSALAVELGKENEKLRAQVAAFEDDQRLRSLQSEVDGLTAEIVRCEDGAQAARHDLIEFHTWAARAESHRFRRAKIFAEMDAINSRRTAALSGRGDKAP